MKIHGRIYQVNDKNQPLESLTFIRVFQEVLGVKKFQNLNRTTQLLQCNFPLTSQALPLSGVHILGFKL